MSLFSKVKSVLNTGIKKFFAFSLKIKIILLVIVLLVSWFWVRPLFENAQKGKIEYITARAEKGTLISSVTASGTVSSAGSASITTGATGVVSQVYVKNGDAVAKGEKIVDITLDADSQQKQAAAWASYLAAQKTLNTEKSKMNSLKASLFEANQNFVADKGVDNPSEDQKADPEYIQQESNWLQAEADYNNQETSIKQAEAALASANLSYQQTSPSIVAPIAGVVTNLTLTSGQVISGNSSDTANANTSNSQTYGTISLPDTKPQAVIALSEIDITKVVVDQKATLTLDAFPDKTFTGKVTSINTSGTTSSGVTSYPVVITFDTAPNNLYQNMAVNATIIIDVKDNVLIVPSAAIQTTNGDSTIRVMKDGEPETVGVTIGNSSDTEVEVLSGISAGDTIVTGQTGGVSSGSASQDSVSPFGGGLGGRNTGFGGAVRIQQGGGGGGKNR